MTKKVHESVNFTPEEAMKKVKELQKASVLEIGDKRYIDMEMALVFTDISMTEAAVEFVKKLDCFELYPAFNGNRKSPENWCHSFRASRRDPNKQVIAFRETCKHFETVKPYLEQTKGGKE
jgi:hypothetical protein